MLLIKRRKSTWLKNVIVARGASACALKTSARAAAEQAAARAVKRTVSAKTAAERLERESSRPNGRGLLIQCSFKSVNDLLYRLCCDLDGLVVDRIVLVSESSAIYARVLSQE